LTTNVALEAPRCAGNWNASKYKTGKKAGTVEWTPYKYFGTLESALSEALQREIRTHPASTIPEAIEAVKTALAKYTAIFDQSVK
jgi:hypothetical protein